MERGEINYKKLRRGLTLLPASAVVVILPTWLLFGSWPSPELSPIPWEPHAIVVLGGGDMVRVREATKLARRYPEAPLLITGDGGFIENGLRANQLSEPRLLIEPDAQSTWENAVFSAPYLHQVQATRVVLVTNWFHVPRAEAIFRELYPDIEFVSAWETASVPRSPWERNSHRREKLAAIYYLLRYGVWSF